MNLNKRSRRRRNINMAQHEPLKCQCVCRRLKRLLSHAIFNNAILRIFFSAFPPTILLWKVLLDLHFSYYFTQKTVKFIKFMDISVNFPWTGMVGELFQNSRKIFIQLQQLYLHSRKIFIQLQQLYLHSRKIFIQLQQLYSHSRKIFIQLQQLYLHSRKIFI